LIDAFFSFHILIAFFFLVETEWLAHCGLEVRGFDVLPVLLEEGDEEVDGQCGVLADFLLLHVDVANAASEAEHLLELEFDCCLELGCLLSEVVTEGNGCWELVGTVHERADDTGDGLDDRLGREERVELGAHLLDELLVLVELLEVFHVHARDALLLCLVLVLEVADDADLHVWTADVWQTECAGETLVLLGVVVLEVDLQVDGLKELALLALREDIRDGFVEHLGWDFGHGVERLVFGCFLFFS